jgi:hypothetical protein
MYLREKSNWLVVLQDCIASPSSSITGTTIDAPVPYGLPLCVDEDRGYPSCAVGCPSRFFEVKGTGGGMMASATATGNEWGEEVRLIVRGGPAGSACSELTCVGMYVMKCVGRWKKRRAASPVLCSADDVQGLRRPIPTRGCLLGPLSIGARMQTRRTTFKCLTMVIMDSSHSEFLEPMKP